jgi:SAM-dependent methyltransferase
MDDFTDVDLRWHPEPLWDEWPRGADTNFMMYRMEQAFLEKAGAGGPGRMLDAACGEARHAPQFERQGWQVVGLEPSPEMIVRAAENVAATGGHIDLFRGLGEVLPFRDETFDRVICQSSLDHYADPSAGMREMARVLRPGGSAVIGLVNYDGFSCRASRVVYRARRRLGMVKDGRRLFWDDPTAGEHTFEGSIRALRQFAPAQMRLAEAYGVSMLWAFPGWGTLLRPIAGRQRAAAFVRGKLFGGIDAVARRFPSASDFVVTTWQLV